MAKKKRNFLALDLWINKVYRPKVKKSKKAYTRKKKHRKKLDD